MATVDQRFITVLGPVKMEVISLTAVTDADTVTSNLVRPLFGLFSVTTDTAAETVATNLGVSGRTVTINNADLTGGADTGVMLLFGF